MTILTFVRGNSEYIYFHIRMYVFGEIKWKYYINTILSKIKRDHNIYIKNICEIFYSKIYYSEERLFY